MRATVAVVETRPQTIREDLDRVLKLAGCDLPADLPARLVASTGPAGHWFPGSSTTPWQAAAACARFGGGHPPRVFGVDERGRPATSPDPDLAAALAGTGAVWAGEQEWKRRPVRPAADLPLLLERTKGLLTVPAGLHDVPLVLLPTPVVGGGWPLAGAVGLLARLLVPSGRRQWRGMPAALLVEVVRLARAQLHVAGTLMDGTLWSVAPTAGRRETVQGNVLLAGPDPVAVDAVACRLAGGDPLRVPWLRACAEEGLGSGNPREIKLVGRTDLVDLGLELPRRLLVSAPRLAASPPLVETAWRWIRRPAALRRHRRSPWGQLRNRPPTAEA